MLAAKEATAKLPDGTEVVLETGRLAKQASGSAVVKVGDAVEVEVIKVDDKGRVDLKLIKKL